MDHGRFDFDASVLVPKEFSRQFGVKVKLACFRF